MDEITPDKFTTPEQFHGSALKSYELYEKETDEAKKPEYLKTAREHTAKANELLLKEREEAAKSKGKFKVPDAYKDKPWASKIKSEEDLYKQLDGLDAKVGKKDVPFDYKDKTPEEIKAHFDARRPAKPEEYKIGKETDHKPLVDEFKAMCWEAGMDQKQAEIGLDTFRKYQEKQKATLFDPDDFNARLEEAFGKDYKKEAGYSSNVMAQFFANEEEKNLFDQAFPNEQATLVHKLVHRIAKKYGVVESDKGVGGNKGGGGGNKNEDAITERKNAIRKELDNMSKRPHTNEERKKLVNELTELNRPKS